ncbi:MAG: methionine gamma-lyase family protein [Lachnospiraceae bacterium]|nr:methionine gamma-lyase family protein [Lachnospiraceae bacterium]
MTMETAEMYDKMGVSREVYDFTEHIIGGLKERFDRIDDTAEYNQLKVLKAMQDNGIGEAHLSGTTGYGYNDIGREALEKVYADIFHTEDALVRPQIACGTHALSLALFSALRPGDELLSASGKPYDTLEEVIGIRPSGGSLAEYGITYAQAPLDENGRMDPEAIRTRLSPNTKLAAIQRSKGYQTRPTFSVKEIGEIVSFIKGIRPDIRILVDNCYGEFVERIEPSEVGADLVAGSLIKNPGGGLAPCGGYLVGRRDMIEAASHALTSPGLGKEVGASLGVLPLFYQGLFLAPTVTASALKGAIFAAAAYEALGFPVYPKASEKRHDIIQAVTLQSAEAVISFCRAIQAASPVDSFAAPEPWPMPGYDSDVIMAAGNFVSGSSIELSADAPIREPYTVYFQGGLTWPHARFGITRTIQQLLDDKMIDRGALKCYH